jgi:hypothetical protein
MLKTVIGRPLHRPIGSAVRPVRRPICLNRRPTCPICPPVRPVRRPTCPAVRSPSAGVKPPSAVVKPPSAVHFSKSPDAETGTSTSSGRPDANVCVPASEQPWTHADDEVGSPTSSVNYNVECSFCVLYSAHKPYYIMT